MADVVTLVLLAGSALVATLAAIAVARGRRVLRLDRDAVTLALGLTAVWCGVAAAVGPHPPAVRLLEIFRNLAWIFALFRHFANDGRDESLRLVRPLVLTLGMVEGLQFVLLAVFPPVLTLEITALLRMLVAVGALTLTHNLYGGASDASRRLLGWNSAGMALYWGFELNLFTITYLTGETASGLDALRAIVVAASALCVALGALQGRAGLAFRPSRAVTFSTVSLAVLGVYFLAMVGLANGAARLSQDLARITQVAFLLAAVTGALLWLPSPGLRARLRVLTLKHFFKHRYDYRAEWLRFTGTMGTGAGQEASLQVRAIRALADIADSPGGLLLSPGEDGDLILAARWGWGTAEVPALAVPAALGSLLEKHRLILDIDEARDGRFRMGEEGHIPRWLLADDRAWAGVPLLHRDRLIGIVVLARPFVVRQLDWEDFDLLSIAGQQVASYLAEQAGQEALQDAARFDEFNRRMAFVMHDIKNLSSQLGLLARNAERHAENPAFRSDMLVTLRNSADKLNALVGRLGRYGRQASDENQEVELVALARKLAKRREGLHRIDVVGEPLCVALGQAEQLEQALEHLVQNAIDASEPGGMVTLVVHHAGLSAQISVVDAGQGMSPQFIRHSLFRPFVSTKENGFGIGTCEARDLIRAMGGRLDVESHEGVGSRFTVSLPSPEASRLIAQGAHQPFRTESEKAA